MSQINIQDKIAVNAPISKVWEAIEDPSIHMKWHPFTTHITGKHMLGEVRKCDVKVGNETGHTEERCAVYAKGRKIMWLIEKDSSGFSSMVSDWMAGFNLESQDPNTTIVMALSTFRLKDRSSEGKIQQIEEMFHKTQQAIIMRLKQFVEKGVV